MAKKDDYFSQILKETNGQSLAEIGDIAYFIDTGSLALNYISSGKFIGGGIPGCRITEAFGPNQSGKSLFGDLILGANQRMGGISVKLDCEHAASPDFTEKAAKVDVNKLLVYEPRTLEEVERKVTNVTRAIRKHFGKEKPILFSWDSISVNCTEREWKEVELPEEFTDAEFKKIVGRHEQPGERAKIAGAVLRKLNPFLRDNNVTLYIVNQMRSAIGVMYGSPEVRAGGGEALPYYTSLSFRTAARKKILDKDDVPIGVNLKFVNKKNRCHTPALETEGIQLYYAHGVDPLSGLLTLLIGAKRIEGKSGNYRVLEPWCGDKEVKFKASLEKNELPMSVALQCPKLLDANSEKEVADYLAIFNSAMELSKDSSLKEKDVKVALEE